MIIRWLKEMCAWWLNVLIIVTFLTFVNSKIDLDSPISLARCRATCLFKMQISRLTDLECSRFFNCSQCWKACVAVKSRSPLCAAADCGTGSPSHVSPVALEKVLVVNDSRVSWPPMSGPVVYVVMADGSPFCQTLEPSVTLSSALDLETVRVLVVDWRGLVKVVGPVAESPVDQALHILRSLGMENNLDLANLQYPEEFSASSVIPKVIFHRVWRLEVESVHHQPPLVMGKISWRHYHHQLLKGNLLMSYLVTWSMDGGGVQGKLLTNTPTVTLSLLPDTLYRIEVSMLNQRSSNVHSELLVLDTHHFYTKSNNLSSGFRRDFIPSENTLVRRYQRFDEVTIILVFLGVILVLAWRWRYRNFLPKKRQSYERIDYLKL